MKPFNLERAKAGDPVVTRDGRKARYGCSYNGGAYRHIFMLSKADGTESPTSYTDEGFYMEGFKECLANLFMAPIKKEGWINIYRGGYIGKIYDSEDEANSNCECDEIQTIKIEWEE